MMLLAGKSGTGKDFIVETFNLKKVISHTTRLPRENEVDGIDKYFHKKLTNIELKKIKKDSIAYTYFNGNHYWATKEDLISKDVYIIDVNGIVDLYNRLCGYKNIRLVDVGDNSSIDNLFYSQFKIVYLTCAWWKRMYRLIKRDGWKKGIKRFFHDIEAFKDIKKFRYKEVRL